MKSRLIKSGGQKSPSYELSQMRLVAAVAITAIFVGACSNYDETAASSENVSSQQQFSDVLAKCEQDDRALGVSRPNGWGAMTHCESAPPNAEVVFPKNKIPTLLIKMKTEDYARMQADLDDLLGGGAGELGAEEFQTACESSYENDSCQAQLPDGTGYEEGTCLLVGDGGSLGCVPNAWLTQEGDNYVGDQVSDVDFYIPPDPCANSFEGNSCAVEEAKGFCVSDSGPLICEIPTFDQADVSSVPLEGAATFADRKPKYFKADLEFEGVFYKSVGIRYKGNSSLRPGPDEKKPLRIKMDEWEKDIPAINNQRLYGFHALSFAPNRTDESYLKQVLAASEFRENGAFAPLSGYVEISLDTGEGVRLLGLYSMTEIPDDPMLDRVFSNSTGNLYKPDGRGAHLLSFIEESMHKKNNKIDANFDDVKNFINALHADKTLRSEWRENLSKRFDVLGFIEFLAVSIAINNWDTYGAIAHNYYLYHDENSQQLNFIPWDFDLSFDRVSTVDMTLRTFDGSWPLIQAVARDATYATHYQRVLQEIVTKRFSSGELDKEINRLAELIRPAVQREASSSGDEEAINRFDLAVKDLKENVERRKSEIQQFIDTQTNQNDQPTESPRVVSQKQTVSSHLKLDASRSSSSGFLEGLRIKTKLTRHEQSSQL